MTPAPLLAVKDLAVARGGITLLAGVTFTLLPGQAIVLGGPNGVGKTTLLRSLARLQPPVAGRIAAGPDVTVYAGHADGVKPALSLRENLSFWARVFGRGDIGPALSAFDLASLADRPARNLSAGQRRRAGLARLIVAGRPVWLADEPTVSLDRASVGRFRDAVARHLSGGGGAVLATHLDLDLPGAVALDLAAFRPRRGSLPAAEAAFG
jgi:heme exporter protein A